MRLESISAVFPAYNDEQTISGLVRAASRLLPKLCREHEIIVVNDGSRDGTAARLEALRAGVPELRVIEHPRNRGYGGALISGFQAARHEWVFYTDGDGQYDLAELGALVAEAGPDLDLVNGYKRARGDSWTRIIVGEAYRRFVRRAFGVGLSDVDCDFRLFRRKLLERAMPCCRSGAFPLDLVLGFERAGCRTREVPVSHRARTHGRSQFFRLGPIAATLRELASLWWRRVGRERMLRLEIFP